MKTPEKYLDDLFPELRSVTLLDKSVDLHNVVSIPHDEALVEVIEDQPERRAKWAVLVAKVSRRLEHLRDQMEELRGARFRQYYATLEEKERAEWQAHMVDEDEVRDDFGRKKRIAHRLSQGVKSAYGRWRRNFSDDLVWSYVNDDIDVIHLRKEIRAAKAALDIALGVRDALDHRARCLSHLSAHLRDGTRP